MESFPQSPKSITVFRTGDKPLRFTGLLLADVRLTDRDGSNVTRVRLFRSESNSYIWSWDRYEAGDEDYEEQPEFYEEEPETSALERADAIVVSVKDPAGPINRSLDETIRLTWESRPTGNGQLVKAATRAWQNAGQRDSAIAKNLYEEIE